MQNKILRLAVDFMETDKKRLCICVLGPIIVLILFAIVGYINDFININEIVSFLFLSFLVLIGILGVVKKYKLVIFLTVFFCYGVISYLVISFTIFFIFLCIDYFLAIYVGAFTGIIGSLTIATVAGLRCVNLVKKTSF